jgi:PAS domain S-box-containing protein
MDSKRSSDLGNRLEKKVAKMGGKALNHWPKDAQKLNAKLDQMVAERTTELRALNRELSVKAAKLEQKLSEFRQTQKMLNHLASFPEINPNPVVEVNADGSIEYLNPTAKKLFPDLQDMGHQHEWLVDFDSIIRHFRDQEKTSYDREIKMNSNWYHQSFHLTPGVDHIRIYGLDITERKRTEEALRESERRMNSAQEIAHLGSWELDLVNNRLTWSDEVYRIFGLHPQEFGATYEAFLKRVHPDDRAAVDAAYSGSLREHRDMYEIEHRVVRNDTGDTRVVHEKCEHFRDATGEIIRSVGMVQDITERKRMEEELRKSHNELEMRVHQRTVELVKANELLEGIFSGIDTMIAYLDKDFNFIRVNRAYAEADERTPEFYIGKNHFVLFPNEENEQIFRKVVETGQPYSVYAKPFEYDKHSERGVTYWDWSLQPVKEPDGSVGGVVLSLVNVTDRIQAEASVHQQAALLELAHDSIIVRDMEDRILFWNHGAEEMYGWGKDEALAKVSQDLLQTQYPKLLDEIKIDLIRKGHWEGELVNTQRDGKKIIVESRWALQRGKEDRPTVILQINRDITERKRAQAAMEAERQRFNDVLEILPAYLVLLSPDYHVPFANRFFRERFGESHGQRCFEYLFGRSEPCETCETYTALKTNAPHHWEWTGPDGRNYDVFDFPFTDTDGSVLILEMGIDITERKQAQGALRAVSLYTRSLIEANLDPLVTISPDGKIMDVNSATELTTGVPRDELIRTDFSDYFTEPEKAREGYQRAFREGFVRDYPLTIRHTSGKVTDVLYHATVYKNEVGEIQGVFAAARDITVRKELQRRIEATNALLNLFVRMPTRKEYLDAALELIQNWSNCRCAGIRVLNEKDYIPYESYRGFSRPFWESENLLSVKYDQCACIRVVMGNPDPQDHPRMTPAGSFWCNNTFEFVGNLSEEEKARFRGVCVQNGFKSVAIIPIRYREKILGAIHLADEKEGIVPLSSIEFIESMAPLIGEAINRFNLEEELRESEGRLRLLSSELLTVQEAERKRIAREIHDSIGQTLAAIKFGLESKLSQMGAGTPPPGVSIENIISLAQNGIEESRRIQMDLRPSILDDLGILATIGWFTREFQKVYSHISIEKEIQIEEPEIPAALKTSLFRIMQEAMNNIAKHSKGDFVRLSLRKIASKIEMTIEDDGAGFDLENIKQGLGLTSMRERTELSGGTFEIESAIGKGTTIRARWTL